ncbi:hypothetical protein Plec18167_007026 [Paecilomyces lecythidis]|uniref:Uncharacterized protein n=1 Tax=Paecilomyces lecythidis TaxID=3004212 RepID=A0ABR3X734_9EURO
MAGVGHGPGSPETLDGMRLLRSGLEKLPSRLVNMINLQCFSLFSPYTLPTGQWIPQLSIASILDSLPQTCVSLEVDVRSTYDRCSAENNEQAHLCTPVRRLLPQLRFLRLSLPEICPEAFGRGFDSAQPSIVATDFKPTKVPCLEQCLVKVADPVTGAMVRAATLCGFPDVGVVAVLARHLQAFASPQNAPRLQKLWMVDALPMRELYHTFESLVRRDVLANRSQAIPFNRIGGMRNDGIFIRMPTEESSQDLISTFDGVKGLVERFNWVNSLNGTRLPATDASQRARFTLLRPLIRTREEWAGVSRISSLVWSYEKKTASRVLDVAEGGLTDECVPTVHIPNGWIINVSGMLDRSE